MTELLASGDRVALRWLTEDDIGGRYLAWMRDPEVVRYLESRFEEHSLESLRAWVGGHSGSDTLLLAVQRVDTGAHVGNIKIGPLNPQHGTADLGIMIGDRESHGLGIGSEALRLAPPVAERELGLRKLTASCYSGNVGAITAFTRAGWIAEGRRLAQFVDDQGGVHDQVLFGWLF